MPFVTGTTKSKGKTKIPGSKGSTSITPPKSARSPSGARKYAEENLVTETLPSGKVVKGAAGTASDVATAKRNIRDIERISGVLATLPYSPKSDKKYEKLRRENQAETYKNDALSILAETHYKRKEDGSLDVREEKVPRIKTSTKAIKVAETRLKKELANAMAKGVGKREAKIALAVGTKAIAKENYVTDKHGNVEYRTVRIPKLRTNPKAVRQDLKRINRRTKEIKQGKHQYFRPRVDDSSDSGILGTLVSGTSHVVGKAVDAASTVVLPSSGVSGTTSVDLADEAASSAKKAAGTGIRETVKALKRNKRFEDERLQAAGLGFVPAARSKAMHGIRTGLLLGGEYLTRPGLAVEAQIAKRLSEPGLGDLLLSEKGQRKLGRGASPGEVLLHGHGAKHVISGGEITDALFGAPQLGLPLDIVTDPLMYLGGAGLPAKFAERAAAITDRVAREAPEALRDAKYIRLMESAQKSGDFEGVVKHLEQAAKKHGVSLSKLGKTKSDKAVIAEVNRETNERAAELVDLVRRSREEGATLKGKSLGISGEAGQRAAEEIARFGLRRALKPGFTLEVRTPLGRKLGGIEVPVPRKLAEKRLFIRPGGLSTALGREPESSKLIAEARKSEANAQVYQEFAAEHEKLLNKVSDIEANPTSSRHEITVARNELADIEDKMRARMMNARTANASTENLASMDEMFSKFNAKRLGHELYRHSNALGRQTQQVFLHNVMTALKPVMKDQHARVRIGAHMAAEADMGTRAIMDTIAPLTAKESQVMSDLRNIYSELAKYGVETGALKNVIENYLPRYWSDADEITGSLRATLKSQEVKALGGKRGSASAYQQHRTMAEMAAIADKQKLAQMLKTVATKPISDEAALKLADEWYKHSKIRFAMEDTAQAINRGQILKEEQLTDLQKAAYEWSNNMVSNNQPVPRLFQDLENTEGVLKLHPEAYKFHNLIEDPFSGLSTKDELRVKLSSARESEAKIVEAMSHVAEGSPLHGHYEQLLEQRQKEIAALHSQRYGGILPSQKAELDALEEMKKRGIVDPDFQQTAKLRPVESPDRAITPVNDGSEAPTAEQVGLASDREIEDFLPNATDEYVGTLKDFRRDHPDEFPILDPVLSNYHRTRAEALQTTYRTRWRAADKAVGRSSEEARASRYVLADGRKGYTSDLKPVFGEGIHDKPIAYEIRSTNEKVDAANVDFPGRTLIPNKNYEIWYDPTTGREYVSAAKLDPNVGAAIADAIGPDRLWPTDFIRDVRAEFYRMGENGITDLYDSGVDKLWQRALTNVRYGVTTLFPAFHVRNMISDTFQSILGDPGFLFHPVSNAKLTWAVVNRGGKVKLPNGIEFGIDSVKVPHLGKMAPEDLLATMDAFGLRSNQHIAEFARLAEQGNIKEIEKWQQGLRSYRRPVQMAKGGFGFGPSGAVGKRAIEASARREDIMRMITFSQRMRRNGGDFADAMWWTVKHHFDYGDLTLWERRTMRNLFLFYTWYRKNIPLQLLSVITRPGFMSGVTNTYIDLAEGETPLNFNWSKINPVLPNMSGKMPHAGLIPDYMLNQLAALTTNWNGHALAVGFGAPWSDLNLIGHLLEDPEAGVRQFGSMLNPAFSALAQFAMKGDLLTGRKFDKREKSGFSSMLSWLDKKFGTDALGVFGGQYDDEGSPLLPWQLNLMFNQLPVAGRLSGYARSTPSTEDQGRINKWFGGSGYGSFFTGLNAYMSPKEGERLDAAYISRIIGRSMQRKELSEQGGTEADLHDFDRETQVWAKQLGIPHKYLEVVPGIGPAYVTQEERESFTLGGTSPLTGGSGGGELRGLLGGEGKPNFESPSEEYDSQTEEGIEKLHHPGKFNEQTTLTPLGSSFAPLGSSSAPTNTLASGAGQAGQGQLNQALGRLRENASARKAASEPGPRAKTVPLPDKKAQKKAQEPINRAIAKVKEPKDVPEKKLPHPKIPKIEGIDNKDQQEFAQWFSFYSKIPPKLAGEWVKQEGGGWGSDGVSGGEAGEQNWLGIGYPGHTTPMSESKYFNKVTPKEAAKNSALWLEGKIGHEYQYRAAPSIVGISKMVKQGASEGQIKQYIEGPSAWGTGAINQSGIAVNGKTHGEPDYKIVHSRKAAKTVIKLANKFAGTQEGTKLQAHWAAVSGISSSEAWCSAFLNSLMRRVGLPEVDAPASAGTWATWKGGKPIGTTDLNKAHPGDIIEFGGGGETDSYADHVGLYIGNGEMISGNFGDEVRRGPISEESRPIQAIVRPNYTGKKVTFKLDGGTYTTSSAPGGTASGGSYGLSTSAAQGQNRKGSSGKEENERPLLSGGGSSASLGTGALLTTTEAYGLGSSTAREGEQITDEVKRALAKVTPPPRARSPKFNLKYSRL